MNQTNLPTYHRATQNMDFHLLFLLLSIHQAVCLIPPKFQWKTIDFAWEGQARDSAIAGGDYIPENNMPTGLARWKDKLFLTIPRWKSGVPSSLNFVYLNGSQSQPLNPYPSWPEGFVSHKYCCTGYNSTVVSAFRAHVDRCDRLWVVDNGVADMANEVRQIADPAILIFDLNTDTLIHKHVLGADVLQESSFLTNIVVDIVGKGKDGSDTFAYITDSGSNAIIVFSLNDKASWRVENHYFHFDPHAGEFKVGGIKFYVSEGISNAALSPKKSDGYRDLYFSPTSSTKQFKMSTKLLRNRNAASEDIFNGVQIIGEKGPKSQATACDFDPQNNVLFYTQVNKNAVGCWNTEKPFSEENTPDIFNDCTMLEFPNDIKVDQEGNLWILSDRQSRFLYDSMDFTEVNFRVLTAPVASFIQGTKCEKQSAISKAFSFMKRPKSAKSCCNSIQK